ncbi:NlpC/P60 family protein [Leucobacter denitrificans]|uniref:C40 family peptidase n=1 Tax=Leucobacter denitrificans TaxID=683042 RepID=A0A7G9S3V3_9MICO|nr:NlpC/P60 family protein [Leucobacter denitrificans]QNN62528.1 C40 family peptidase [Leucobacter denitrificans]
MVQHPNTEVVAAANQAAPTAPTSVKVKKIAKVTGAAVFTFAMFGTLALPAYAMNSSDAPAEIVQSAPAQSIKVTAGPALVAIDDVPLEVATSAIEQERLEREIAEAEAQAEAREEAAAAAVEVPAGEGAGGLVSAALAQVGVAQDCTDLAQNSLAAIGLTERRDQGGYDHGVSDFFRYGESTAYVHGTTALAPGDLLMWPGAPHVAVYIGNGQAVHGGWTGGTTVVAGLSIYAGLPTHVVRMS